MSDWIRIGRNPSSDSGLYGAPQPVQPVFYLAYRSGTGREEVTHTYDPATASFTAVKTNHVTITVAVNLVSIAFDGVPIFQVTDGVVSVAKFTERSVGIQPSVVFYSRRSTTPEPLAVLTKTGTFSVRHIKETEDFGDATDLFRFLNNGSVVATISKEGLQAIQIQEA